MSSVNVRVVVRCRPMSTKEINSGCRKILMVDPSMGTVTMQRPNTMETIETMGRIGWVYD